MRRELILFFQNHFWLHPTSTFTYGIGVYSTLIQSLPKLQGLRPQPPSQLTQRESPSASFLPTSSSHPCMTWAREAWGAP